MKEYRATGDAGGSGKDALMWVFDGEEWTDEGVTNGTGKVPDRARYEAFTPELQVVEIVHTPRTNLNDVPYPPLPMP